MAADAEPLEILLHLPLLCEDKVKSTSYCVQLCCMNEEISYDSQLDNNICKYQSSNELDVHYCRPPYNLPQHPILYNVWLKRPIHESAKHSLEIFFNL